jgi:hypothetical protein
MALKNGSRHCRPLYQRYSLELTAAETMFLLGNILHNAQGNKLVIARTFAGRVVQAAGPVVALP